MPEPGLSETQFPTAWPDHPLRVFTLTGARQGLVLALVGAVHGDELEGPLTLAALMRAIDPVRLRGRLILCPAANPEAISAGRRCSPSDGGNLARCFPGDPNGHPTEVLAHLVAHHVIHPADALIDLHSGGGPLECPVFAGYGDDPATGAAARAMAQAFGAPVVWRHPAPMPPGRTLSEARDIGIPAIYAEAGGGICPPASVLALYEAGVLRVMAHLGMIDAAPPAPATAPRTVRGSGDLDAAVMAPASGLCTCRIGLLDRIEADTPCFDIADLDGRLLTRVRAGVDGIAMFLRRGRWVTRGDLLMAIARPDD